MRNNTRSAAPAHRSSQKSQQQPSSAQLFFQHRNGNNPYGFILVVGVLCLASMSLIPIFLLETTTISTIHREQQQQQQQPNSWSSSAQVAVHDLMDQAWHFTHPDRTIAGHHNEGGDIPRQAAAPQQQEQHATGDNNNNNNNKRVAAPSFPTRPTKDGRLLPDIQVHDLPADNTAHFREQMPLARGVAGRALSETPALQGAQRAHVQCPDLNVDSLAYWNDPTGPRDCNFQSPFRVTPSSSSGNRNKTTRKYISFSTDRGGWNNVRMSLEILFVIAAATGRTLVLPPKEPLYLMHHDKENRYRGFADFFPIHTAAFQQRVSVVTFEEFFALEGDNLPWPSHNDNNDEIKRENVENAADHCDKREKSSNACKHVFDYLAAVADHVPEISALHTCLVFDQGKFETGQEPEATVQEQLQTLCGDKREVVYWTKDEKFHEADLIHFRAAEKQYRLLTHYYGMIHFTDPAIDNHYKRFVRDFLHYHDAIYCAAGKIVKAVQWEGQQRGFVVDENGAGAYSALHVRRGDLQYKKVKIPAQEWYDNTKEVWQPKEILYVATDERDKSFFDDLAKHHDLRFLDDYWDMAGLGDLDPNYMGMIDTIVASRGRAFAGTWFSTFSGYINRLRGYHGMSMMDSWYSFLPKKEAVHEWNIVDHFAYAFEWPDGWVGIDADVWPSRDKF